MPKGERALKHFDQSSTRQRQPDGPQYRSTPIAPSEIPEQEEGQDAEEHGVNDLVEDVHESIKMRKYLDQFSGAGQRSERNAE